MGRVTTSMATLFWLGCLLGCGGGGDVEEVPPLEKVSGSVTLDGQPVPGISVTFVPAGTAQGSGAYGQTDAEGQYTLTYRTGDPGIPEGSYVVLFSKMAQPDGSPIPEGQTAADVNAQEMIPERYRTTSTPVHNVNVPRGGGSFDFELTSK